MEFNFLEIPHDATFLGVHIDRTIPGIKDEIIIKLLVQEKEIIVLFGDVYKVSFDMNFGIIADETIRYVDIISDDPEIFIIKEKWKSSNFDFSTLKCYSINTNSTNSILKIYACRYTIS